MKAKLSLYGAILGQLIFACLAFLILYPVTAIIRRKPGRIVFLGRNGGGFLDNCKHLFAALTTQPGSNLEPIFLARDTALAERIRKCGGHAVVADSLKGWRCWLTAGTIVVDNSDWRRHGRYAAARGARLVQLWHGIPLKHIELSLFQARLAGASTLLAWILRFQRWATGRYAMNDVLLSTSRFVTDNAFESAFNFACVVEAGYPRNDVLLGRSSVLHELGVDDSARECTADHKKRGAGLIGLYAPTFRKDFASPFATGQIDLEVLSRKASELGILLLVKLHPALHPHATPSSLPGLRFVEPDSDTYPLMREVDFLITDYSSIFFDFLLLDRPILFFPYDLDSYLRSDRPMYFDYVSMTPGPKAFNTDALCVELARLAGGEDSWKTARREIREKVFSHHDASASDRMIATLRPPTPQSQ